MMNRGLISNKSSLIGRFLILVVVFLSWSTAAADDPQNYARSMHEQGLKIYHEQLPQALAGDAPAQYTVGSLIHNGQGVEQDYSKALKWFRKAAVQGHAGAQYSIGHIYQEGQGVTPDYKTALRWYKKAAASGDQTAPAYLGFLYEKGEVVERDLAEARRWHKMAAEFGFSQIHLGKMYRDGQGGDVDYILAYAWFNVAKMSKNPWAAEFLEKIAEKMTAHEILSAEKNSLELFEKHRLDKRDFFYFSIKPKVENKQP